MASSSTTNTLPHRYEARPCRAGGGVAPSRHAVRAAFNFPTTMANTGCAERQCVCESLNGSQVRRGSLIGSPSALLSAARGTWLARRSSAQQSGNPDNGGAHTALGLAEPYSLTATRPLFSISQPIPRRAAGRKSEAWRRPGHRTSSAAVVDGENVRRAVRAVVGRAHLATGAAVCPSPEKRRKGQTRCNTPAPWYAPGRRAAPLSASPQSAELRATLRAALFHPATARGGHCGREEQNR